MTLLRTGLMLLCLLTLPVNAGDRLTLSTTTSTDNSGLLAVLNQVFTDETGIPVAVIAVGTGQALKLGAKGDVDIALVHAPEAEMEYVAQGHFIDRRYVMYNDFVLVGPADDPARVGKAPTIGDAFRAIAQSGHRFVSRGDDSGTHQKELQIWRQADIAPAGSWYVQAGQGMGAVLKMADEMQAYALTDRGTQIAYENKMSLPVLYQGDSQLANPYHIMAVNPERHVHVRYDKARAYIDFITGDAGKALIDGFAINGQTLFFTAEPDSKR